jgi:hypothetical protein
MQVGEIPLSRIMQNISLRYTKWINFRRSRTGHVFLGRYKALLLDADAYLLELVRYVHLNPVRAGMVTMPETHPWSGHQAFIGVDLLPWLTTEWVLSMLSPRLDQARKAYRAFVADGIAETTRRGEFHTGTCEGRILGDDSFADNALGRANQQHSRACSLSEVIAAVCQRYGISESQLKAPGKNRPYNEARAVIAYLIRESHHLSLTEFAKLCGRDVSALGKAASGVAQASCKGNAVAALIEELRTELGEYPKL